jgi:uncharacterized protein with HEPN domain
LTKKNSRSDAFFVEDMIIAAENVIEFTHQVSFAEFEHDYKTASATLYNLQIIGEGAGKVSLKIRRKHPEINWRAMKAFRNYLAHEYFGISLNEVWAVIQKNIPADLKNLRLILLEIESSENKKKGK